MSDHPKEMVKHYEQLEIEKLNRTIRDQRRHIRGLNKKIKELQAENLKLQKEKEKLFNGLFVATRQRDRAHEIIQQTDIRPEVEWFSRRMEHKLKLNDHKPHWSKSDMDYLLQRLLQETKELWDAVHRNEPIENIINEATDVANFAMMIADNAERLEEKKVELEDSKGDYFDTDPIDESAAYGNDCPSGRCEM